MSMFKKRKNMLMLTNVIVDNVAIACELNVINHGTLNSKNLLEEYVGAFTHFTHHW